MAKDHLAGGIVWFAWYPYLLHYLGNGAVGFIDVAIAGDGWIAAGNQGKSF